ncbi:Histidine phosphatase superfamily (branch 1) [Roseivivax sp. THAF40]|uniref:histidine phosphatase family protein n=1 Tax=unclassified Roseivivax TaxID=2639302 RepID=UPI001267D2C4|nr:MULTISPECIES: histidine phosphatase family protein [unclassified Roseivivax]QFS82991.1 Histidine phosphatase superfamily (branch 1) [Roseivivax sp. THAF197b]QFT46762.1 Histidine phosphatase superfamily (branch 1) [Roseivivax sp. THAF40]
MQRRQMVFGLGALVLAGCATRDTDVAVPPGTTLIMVRHGEKDGDALTAAGQARAAALAARLAATPIDRIYSTSYTRNVLTAQPVADQKGLPVETVPDSNVARRILPGNAGRTILWVGNKGNLAPMWEAIGLPGSAPLAYGDIAFVSADAEGRVTVAMERFGA